MFTGSDSTFAIFLAASVGALVPILFWRAEVAGTKGRSGLMKIVLTWCHIVLAGYVAAFVLQVTLPFQAFLVGLAIDVLLTGLRQTAIGWTGAFVRRQITEANSAPTE